MNSVFILKYNEVMKKLFLLLLLSLGLANVSNAEVKAPGWIVEGVEFSHSSQKTLL